MGLYVQDQWRLGRATIQGALRYDRAWSWFPTDHNGAPLASRFNAAPITFPTSEGVTGFNDITPRMGLAYDLFGNGKTALKVNLGKYLTAATNQSVFINANPAVDGRGIRASSGTNFVTNTTRSWIDGNGNKIIDCDLANKAANSAGGDTCGAWGNQNFGNAVALLQIDPNVRKGWGVRPSDWHLGVSVTQQLMPRVSIDVGYNRRWFENFFVVDNQAVTPDDFDKYTLTAPLNPGLPGGGGYAFTALNVKPAKFGVFNNYYTLSSNYGDETRYWQGVDVTLTARVKDGLTLTGGTSTGRGYHDNCDIVRALPETLGNNQYAYDTCKVTEPWLNSIRANALYTVPKIGVLLSTVIRFQNTTQLLIADNTPGTSGPSLASNVFYPNSVIAQALGRLPSGGLSNGSTTINVLAPGQLYQPTVRTMDMRFAKVLTFGRTRTNIGIDLFNLFNSNTGTAYNGTFGFDGATWNRPTAILNPRAVRFNATLNY